MEKEFYEVPEMEVTSFEMTDIIAASDIIFANCPAVMTMRQISARK